jgi:Cu/Ag efflux pump CusA
MAALYFLLIPVALAGGVLVAVIMRDSLSTVALLGLLTVLAMAVRGGMVQIKRYRRLREDGQELGPDLVTGGSREQFGPAVTGLLAAGLALLPVAVLGTAAGLEIVMPLALIVLGGLVTTAVVNLFVLPCLYLRFERR